MTPVRTAARKEISDIEYGEAVFAFLKRKTERHLEKIAQTQDEQVLELLRSMLAMHDVQVKLVRERYRLSVLRD